jgi:hypothetical protein
MPTRLSVFNDALKHLKEPGITDPDVSNETGRVLRDGWQGAVDTCFEAYPWNFAMKRAELQQLSHAPVFGYRFYYGLPSDYMRLVFITDLPRDDTNPLTRYAEEGGQIAADAPHVYLRYVSADYKARIGDWSQQFANYVAAELASRCFKLNTSGDAEKSVAMAIKQHKNAAESFDSMANPPVKLGGNGSWANARRGGGYGRGYGGRSSTGQY